MRPRNVTSPANGLMSCEAPKYSCDVLDPVVWNHLTAELIDSPNAEICLMITACRMTAVNL